ncbi:Mth938-like domain-containing protein [Rickettsiella endosymbiont of Dermanyssus gallinae]|uniref:Mth938-like domain-containing protein n=1 Tax=Rickettsiella endosymbiont of Dermanyssus gallinae TaxID=2856608 RepID=UPI001C529697|nr:Mth938-like domain-containing protein [Rickettsiella endosymbiont of Dermanyssus gallinae]
MELNLDSGEGQYHIRGYGDGFIQINDEKVDHSIIVSANKLIDPWPPQSLAELNPTHFLLLFDLKPEIVLLGTGLHSSFPDPALLADFYAKKIGIEIMSTAAACRTYAVLMAEGRKVAAALLIR